MSDNVDEWSQTTLQHLKQEMQFKCTTDSCTATFCEKGELLAHQTSHGEQKRITCNYCNHKLSGNITELTRQRFFHVFGEDYIFRTGDTEQSRLESIRVD